MYIKNVRSKRVFMIQDSFNILSEILNDLRRDLSNLNAEIYFNSLHIKKAEERLKSLNGEESDDFKIFSPRSMTEQFKERIESIVSSKVEFEKKNNELQVEKDLLQSKIDKLEEIVRQENDHYTILSVQEKDRQRIARELHDTSLQNLTHLIHSIELCGMYIDDDPQKAKMELTVISNNLREIVSEIRDTIFDLRPMTFDDLSLKAAFERLFEKIKGKNEYELVLNIDDVSCENEMKLLYLYKIVQEGLNNIIKHANAKKIIFKCKVLNSVCFVDLDDDGKGFDIKDGINGNKHFGLSLIKERIEELDGSVNISSVRGEGTKIHIEIPV